jgi:hypothetical protein
MNRLNAERASEVYQSGSSTSQNDDAQNDMSVERACPPLDNFATPVDGSRGTASPEHEMTCLPSVVADPAASSLVKALAVRMADEGVPVRSIARVTRLPSDYLYDMLREEIGRGNLVELPQDDWQAGSKRGNRVQAELSGDEDELKIKCIRCFKLTPLEASVFVLILKREHITKDQIHANISHGKDTDPKMIDVVMCKLRKKLKAHGLTVQTLWATGYCMEPEIKTRAFQMILNQQDANG